MSKGAQALLKIVEKIFPNQKVVFEHNIADRGGLFIDIYLPHLNIGFEYDGEQHVKFVEHFHGTKENFLMARKRDQQKDELCELAGIALVRVRYDEDMTIDLVRDKIERALDAI